MSYSLSLRAGLACLGLLAWFSPARAGITWEDPVAVDTGVSVLAAGEGNVLASLGDVFWVVYEKSGDVYAASRTAQGWQNPVRLTTNASVQTRPRIAADQQTVYVVWEDRRGTRPEIWFRRYSGGTWATEQAVTSNDAVASRFPSISASTYQSGAFLAWEDSTASGFRVYYSSYVAGQWSAREAITNNTAGQRHPSVALRGGALVAWEDARHGASEIYQRFSVNGGWLDEDRVTDWDWPCTHPSAAADFYDIWFAPFVAFEAGTAGGGAEIRIKSWSGNDVQVSADDGIPSRRPNASQFYFPYSGCGGMADGWIEHQVAWTDVPAGGGREHYVWAGRGGIDATPGDGLSYSGITARAGEPLARIAQAWIEDRSGVPTLVARVGTTVGCDLVALLGTPALLLAPEGIPDNLVRAVNSCDGSPRQEFGLNFDVSGALESQLAWDPNYGHAFFLDTDENGEARFELRGGGCAASGSATIGCGWQAEYSWTGAKSPDVNGDCRVRPDDLAYVQSRLGTADFCADLDQSGLVGAEDVAIVEATMWDHCSNLAGIDDDSMSGGVVGLHAFPNPARGNVLVVRSGPATHGERLTVIDAGGRRVREWVTEPAAAARTWDLRDDAGRRVPAGLYFLVAGRGSVRLTAPVIVLE